MFAYEFYDINDEIHKMNKDYTQNYFLIPTIKTILFQSLENDCC